ncbi:MAG: hypothetical protein JWO58_137 [Chitinophagaceae bacterium]|nr:hypothetical protein [Chitinophagaceae bacterium]
MKKFLLLWTVLSISYASFAQSNVSVGTPYTSVRAPFKTYFQKGTDILALKAEGKQVILQKLNGTNLSLTSSKVFEDFPKGSKIEYATAFNGSFYLFYSVTDKKNKRIQLFTREINFEEGSFIGEGKQIISTSGKPHPASSFGFRVSYDQSKLLVHYNLSSVEKNETQTEIYVFTDALALSWKNQFNSSTANFSKVLDYAIDHQGTVYQLIELWDNKKDKTNSLIELTTIKAGATEVTVAPVTLDKQSIHKIGLYETPENYILCAGFYTKNINTSSAGGLFVLKANATAELYDAVTLDISQAIINQYTNSVTPHKENYLTLKEVLVEKDGGLTLIGESAHLETERYYTPKGLARNAYFIHYDDILITKIDGAGNLSWMKKLPKHQVGKSEQGQGQMSYRYMSNDKNYYLIFLDNANNTHLSLDDAPVNYVNGEAGSLTAYEVNKEKGSVQRINLLNTKDANKIEVYDFATNKIIPIDAASFVVELSEKRNSDVLIKTTLTQ